MSTFALIAVVEGTSDRRCLGALVEAWRMRVDWADEETFGLVGLDDSADYLDLHKVPAMARARRIPILRSGAAGIVRNALLLVRHAQLSGQQVDGVLVLCDTDGEVLRAEEGRAERDRMELPFLTALGFPHECIEAWVIAGLQPNHSDRNQVIAEMHFDPFAHPEQLSHKENVPKSAKGLKKRLGLDHTDEEQAMVRLLLLAEETAAAGGGPVDLTGGRVFVTELGALLGALTGVR